MNTEDQVCKLEQAKKLKELGVNSPSVLSHYKGRIVSLVETGYLNIESGFITKYSVEDFAHYPAYTVAELGEMLPPDYIASWRYNMDGEIGFSVAYYLSDEHSTFGGHEHIESDLSEAQARAAMLIYLLENDLHKL